MPLIGSFYLPRRTPQMDYRSNIGVASVGAGRLMQENKQIMKSWDLAITAYNSGTKHLLKAKRKLKNPNASLAEIIQHSLSENFGFASKNFYSEFIALVHVIAYQDRLFDLDFSEQRSDDKDPLRFYVSKCPLVPEKRLGPQDLAEISTFNHHLKDLNRSLPKGSILTTKRALPQSLFLELSRTHILKKKPKEWPSLVRNQSCSTM